MLITINQEPFVWPNEDMKLPIGPRYLDIFGSETEDVMVQGNMKEVAWIRSELEELVSKGEAGAREALGGPEKTTWRGRGAMLVIDKVIQPYHMQQRVEKVNAQKFGCAIEYQLTFDDDTQVGRYRAEIRPTEELIAANRAVKDQKDWEKKQEKLREQEKIRQERLKLRAGESEEKRERTKQTQLELMQAREALRQQREEEKHRRQLELLKAKTTQPLNTTPNYPPAQITPELIAAIAAAMKEALKKGNE